MARTYDSGQSTGWHSHERWQLLYAIQGLMLVRTEKGAWAVPHDHALIIPAGLAHDVAMHGVVAMRTAYMDAAGFDVAAQELVAERACKVLLVPDLLAAALCRLADQPLIYDMEGLGPHLAAIIMHEIAHASTTPLALPLPVDGRLRWMCRALIDTPGLDLDIDQWAERVGMSRRTLTRQFRDQTGLSVGQWRRRLRILNTLAIQAAGAPLKVAARKVGYRSAQALHIMVKRELANCDESPEYGRSN